MRVAAVSENLLEFVALRLNLVPTPLLDTQMAFTAARAIMAGAQLGIFDALVSGPKTADDVARACDTHGRATKHLLDCLVGLAYLKHDQNRYENTDVVTKWVVRDSPVSIRDKLLFQRIEWDWVSRLESFVKTGEAIDIHGTMTTEQWSTYQDGMRALAVGAAPEIAKKLPLSSGATRMLDIGGSHGLYSVELCKLHPSLESTILELPEAIARSQENLAKLGMGARVKHRAGDALKGELGEGEYDLVFISNLVHHFSVEENEALGERVSRALKPGGAYVIGDFARGHEPGAGGAIGATGDLYFALTSTSGTWSQPEMAAWQEKAGLRVGKPIRFTTMPGYVCQPGFKS
ncbi:MAG: class I SAM-dependent methyltransferase [Polyangiales bacterium]